MSALLTGGPIRLVDGGSVQRTFLHIEDANRAFQALLDHPVEARNEVYNVGNPANDVSVRDVALLMRELYQELVGAAPHSELVDISGEEFYGPGYEDGTRLPPDVGKMRSLGWEPRHDLRATLRDAMSYYLDPRRSGEVPGGREFIAGSATVPTEREGAAAGLSAGRYRPSTVSMDAKEPGRVLDASVAAGSPRERA
jgi:UDP-apiose/xylose synthase